MKSAFAVFIGSERYGFLLSGLLATAIALSNPCSAATFSGLVVNVADGDTLTVLVDRKQVRVRLAEIDAPESRQPFGTRSKTALRELCHSKTAQVSEQGKDRYGRIIGQVTCSGIDANAEQVRLGLAWVFDRYARPDSPLYTLQQQARANRRGLWVDTQPIPPWEWRRQSRK